MIDLIWDIWQQGDIRENRENISNVRATAESVRVEVEQLRVQVQRMALVNLAMFELAGARLGITEQQLEEKMREINLRDGVEDGKVSTPAKSCIACGRANKGTRAKCLYCGESVL